MSFNIVNKLKISEYTPLIPLQDIPKVEVISERLMDKYTVWGIKDCEHKATQAEFAFTAIVFGAGMGCGSAFFTGGGAILGSTVLLVGSVALSSLSLCLCSLPICQQIMRNKNKIAPILNPDGTIKNIVDEAGRSLLEWAVAYGSLYKENTVKDWCAFIIDKSAVAPTAEVLKSALETAVRLNLIALAKLFVSKGADINALLNEEAYKLKYALKKQDADLDAWSELMPGLCELGSLQKKLKMFAHVFDVKVIFNTFNANGWTARHAAKAIKKLYLAMDQDGLAEIHSSATKKLILDSLDCLIDEEDVYRKIGNLSAPILIDIGFTGDEKPGHAIYLWIYDDLFVYADTGTGTCLKLFEISQPVVIGRLNREKLTHSALNNILSLKNLKQSTHPARVCEVLKKLEISDVVPCNSYNQEEGTCTYKALISCLAGVANISLYLSEATADEIFRSAYVSTTIKKRIQYQQIGFFSAATEFFFVNHAQLFNDSTFCSNSCFLPALIKIKQRFESDAYVAYTKNIAEFSGDKLLAERIELLRLDAIAKLSSVIQQIKENNPIEIIISESQEIPEISNEVGL